MKKYTKKDTEQYNDAINKITEYLVAYRSCLVDKWLQGVAKKMGFNDEYTKENLEKFIKEKNLVLKQYFNGDSTTTSLGDYKITTKYVFTKESINIKYNTYYKGKRLKDEETNE